MHISEGVLAPPVLAAGAVLAAAGLAFSLRRLPWNHIMSVGALSAAFFVASLIHVPLGPGSVHLILNGLMGAVLGWAALPAMAVALLLQALLLQFGGIAVLGVNVCVMGVPAVICGLLFRPWLQGPHPSMAAAFACGSLAVAGSAALFAVALALSSDDLRSSAVAILAAHLPIMIIEGLLTTVVVRFLAKVLPELLAFSSPLPERDKR